MDDEFRGLVRELGRHSVRFAVIGVAGANYFAHAAGAVFTTQDRDLFLPLDPDNLMRAWDACEISGLSLWSGDDPLDVPHDRLIVESKAAAGREKDRLFLATHADALRQVLGTKFSNP